MKGEILDKIAALVTVAFGLVAALDGTERYWQYSGPSSARPRAFPPCLSTLLSSP